jgi:hypothetical protein
LKSLGFLCWNVQFELSADVPQRFESLEVILSRLK